MNKEVSTDVLANELTNLNNKVEDFKKDTKLSLDEFKKDTKVSLADILAEIRGVNGDIINLKSRQSLSESTLTEFKIITNNSIEVLKKDTADHENRLKSVEGNQLIRRGKENGISWVWKVALAVFAIAYFVMSTLTFLKQFSLK